MAETIKIVLTGGPCAGKTSAIATLKNQLKQYGVKAFAVNEQATALKEAGRTPENMGSFEFHSLLFKNQLAEEENALSLARESEAKKAVVLCDRGLLDSRAYVSEEEFGRYSSESGFSEESIRNRYDAVFHLVTAAEGARESYTLKNNSARSEDIEQACALDRKIMSLWVGTQHLRVIDNSTGFKEKLERLTQEVLAVLGIPEPLEIERKFLIEYPDLQLLDEMEVCRRIPITQAYLTTPEEGRFRIRKRGDGGDVLYIKTVKHKINDLIRIEIEDYISEKEFYSYLNRRECIEGIISKDRYCFVWDSQYFELDVYPFWRDRATLELELLSENQQYRLPDFVKLIRDVSLEKEYRNKHLAIVYGQQI